MSQLLLQPPWLLVVVLEVLLIPLLFVWFRQRRMERPAVVASYLQPWKAALLLALIGTASVLLVGMPLGITTSYSKMGAFLLQLVMPDVAAGVPILSTALTIPAIGGGVLVAGWGRHSMVSLWCSIVIIGIIAGSALSRYCGGMGACTSGCPGVRPSRCCGGVIMGLLRHGSSLQFLAPVRRAADTGIAEHAVFARVLREPGLAVVVNALGNAC